MVDLGPETTEMVGETYQRVPDEGTRVAQLWPTSRVEILDGPLVYRLTRLAYTEKTVGSTPTWPTASKVQGRVTSQVQFLFSPQGES